MSSPIHRTAFSHPLLPDYHADVNGYPLKSALDTLQQIPDASSSVPSPARFTVYIPNLPPTSFPLRQFPITFASPLSAIPSNQDIQLPPLSSLSPIPYSPAIQNELENSPTPGSSTLESPIPSIDSSLDRTISTKELTNPKMIVIRDCLENNTPISTIILNSLFNFLNELEENLYPHLLKLDDLIPYENQKRKLNLLQRNYWLEAANQQIWISIFTKAFNQGIPPYHLLHKLIATGFISLESALEIWINSPRDIDQAIAIGKTILRFGENQLFLKSSIATAFIKVLKNIERNSPPNTFQLITLLTLIVAFSDTHSREIANQLDLVTNEIISQLNKTVILIDDSLSRAVKEALEKHPYFLHKKSTTESLRTAYILLTDISKRRKRRLETTV